MKPQVLIKICVLGILLFLILLAVLDFCTPINTDTGANNSMLANLSVTNIDLNAIIQTLISALLGALLSLYIVELVINNSKEKENEVRNTRRSLNVMSVLRYPLCQYESASRIITNSDINCATHVEIPVTMEALCSIFKDGGGCNEPVWTKKIVSYSDALSCLQKAVTSVVLNTDLTAQPELASLLLEYLYNSQRYNSCPALIDMMNHRVEGETLADLSVKHLPELGLEIKSDNICYAFVQLKKLIEYHEDFRRRLEQLLNNRSV